MKLTNKVISVFCASLFATTLTLTCIPKVYADEVEIWDIKRIRVETKRVEVTNDECTLYVKIADLRDLSEYNVRCLDKETGEEYINMDLAPLDGELQIPLAILPLGTYQVEITNRTTNLIIEIEKFDETSDIYYDPFSTSNDEVVR